MTYYAPLKDMHFVLHELVDLSSVCALPGFDDCSAELVDVVLEEAAHFAHTVLAPINRQGDEGARWDKGDVVTAPGFKSAWKAYADLGWVGLRAPRLYGGQGLPVLVATAVEEMWCSANLAFSLAPLLTLGAIEAIYCHASNELAARYLPPMISGKWTGTMNLTEPQAGSDLAQIRTRAVPHEDGSFRITGQKIFITWGEHDLADNIVHLVLARLPDAPLGVKGISLFIVPKFLVQADGSLGVRNDVRCVSIENKLGIHGSPTALMSFGDNGGAVGYLVGEPHHGLTYMFTMMNYARLGVGVEGMAMSERAYQKACQYARERIQGRAMGSLDTTSVPILHHPDIRRMLMTMKSQIEAQRALTLFTATAIDYATHHPVSLERERHQSLVNFLIPIVKGWNTEQANEITSLAVQIHGGMGYIEETGVAQYMRDARITSIYEGTTGIQALDLIGRKIALEKGVTAYSLLARVRDTVEHLNQLGEVKWGKLANQLKHAVDEAQCCIDYILQYYESRPEWPAAGAVPFLKLMGILLGGWQLARAVVVANSMMSAGHDDLGFLQAKMATACFFGDHILPYVASLARIVLQGADSVVELDEAWF